MCPLIWSVLGDVVAYWMKCHMGCSAFFPSGLSDMKKWSAPGCSTGEPWTDEPSTDSRLSPDMSNPGNTYYQFFNFKSSFCPAIKCILLTICIWTFFTFNWNTKIIFINWQITSCGRVDLDAVSIWMHVVSEGPPKVVTSFWRVFRSKVSMLRSLKFQIPVKSLLNHD